MSRIVDAVLKSIESRLMTPDSLEGLRQVEADLLAAATAKGIIGNGGHAYWYEGMDHQQTIRAAEAFERLGLPQAAAAMRKSLEAFPGGIPAADLADRQTYVSNERKRLERDFRVLDETIWEVDFDTAAAVYIRLHQETLIAADPSLRSILVTLH
jgi:hypothetical protein